MNRPELDQESKKYFDSFKNKKKKDITKEDELNFFKIVSNSLLQMVLSTEYWDKWSRNTNEFKYVTELHKSAWRDDMKKEPVAKKYKEMFLKEMFPEEGEGFKMIQQRMKMDVVETLDD